MVGTSTRCDLAQLMQDVLADIQPVVRKCEHQLAATGLDAEHAVMGDAQLLRQVLQNLVSNAVKYTPPGGRIEVEITNDGAEVRCAVTDTGIGVPEVARPRLFEKFFRAENVSTVETEGTGLGLYIVRLIVERAHGRIWFEPAETGGSRFLVALPLATTSEAAPATAGAPIPSKVSMSTPRILLAEDDRFLRKAAETMLKRGGFTVTTAADGEEALRLARESAPDLMLLDLIMPKMQGFDVLAALKAAPETAGIPVIVLSNLGQDSDVQLARERGAHDYIIKSNIALEMLVERVRTFFAERAA